MSKHIGSDLNDFVVEETMLTDSELVAIKRIVAMALEEKISKDHLTRTTLARKIGTSRAAVNRLLNPNNTSVTLHTLGRAARVIEKQLRLSLI